MHQKLNREIKAGIFSVLKNTVNRQSSVRDLLRQLEKNTASRETSAQSCGVCVEPSGTGRNMEVN